MKRPLLLLCLAACIVSILIVIVWYTLTRSAVRPTLTLNNAVFYSNTADGMTLGSASIVITNYYDAYGYPTTRDTSARTRLGRRTAK